ncbi:MAG: hypothetical protein KKD75_05815, partial [Nanoarchaeota archaeon]|nr:hypothetical protein [Nanoarchaeota archaeon]
MKRKIDRILGLFIIYLLIISPISFGQDENDFAANPTLENFNNLENPTIKDFSRLNPEDQIKYLNLNYRDDFAQKFYSNKDNVGKNENVDKQYFLNPKNIGNNPEADKKFLDDYGKTKAREFMTSGSLIEQNNAREIFALILSKNFPATFEIKEVGNKFEYDPITKILSNGGPGIPVNDPSIEKVTSILKAKKEGETKEYGLEIKRIGSEQGVQVFGNVKNTINLFEIDGREIISFIDADGQTQDFDVLPSREVTDKPTSFTIESDKTIIDGPAKGIINTKEGFREFRNHVGVLVLENNGNVQAHNAEVRGRDFLADGSYEKKGNIITARDHGYRDVGNLDKEGRTWIISLPSGMGSRTLNSDGTQTLHLNAINPKSRFAPKEEKPTQKTKEEIINQVKFFDPPRDDVCKPSAGSACKDSEVWFHTDENGVNTVSVKGPAEVGFYDVSAQQGARLIPRTPKFKGHDGLAQFDAQIHPQQVIADIQGKSTYSDEQYVIDEDAEIKDGIYTLQNAAAVRIVRRGINGADALFADCLTGGKVTCNPGERAVEIKKTIAIGRPTGITLWKEQKGREVLSEDGLISVTIALDVNEKGEKRYAFENLGVLGREHTEGKKVILGRDIMMSIPCGEKKTCGLQFGEDKETNAQGLIVPNGLVKAWYEEFDSQKDEVIGKRVPIDMTIGTVVGSHNILTTDKNIDNLRKMLTLIENRQFSQLSQLKLSFDKDPALQYFVFSETGLDIEQVVDPNYVKSMGNIAKRFDDAQEGIKSFNERNKNAGLQLDETGQAICSSKEECEKISERLNTIKQSRRGIDFDILTKIEENFARAKLDTVLSMYLACAGKPICDVKKEDVEKAKNEVVSVVNQRTLAWNEERARELRWKIKHEDNTGEAITEGKAIGEQVKKADDKENKANLEKNDIGKEIETNRKALDQLEEKKEYSIADEQIKEIIRQRLAALSERETELDKNIKDAQQQRKDAQRQRVRFATNNVDRPDLIAKMEDAGGCAACAKSVIEGSAFIPPELRGELLKEYEQKSKVQQNKGKTDFEALVQEVGVARLADQAVYLSDIDDAAGASALLNKVHELKSAGVKIPEGEFDRANQAVGTLFINKLKAQLQTINEFRSNKFAAMVDRTSGFEWDKSAWGNVVAGFDWITYESNLNPANWGQIFGVGMDTYGDKKTDQEIDAINQFQAEADRLALKAIGLERYINAGKTPQEYFNDLDKGKLDQSIVSKGLLGEKFKDFKDRSFGSGVGGTIDTYRTEANGNYLTPAQQADILLYNAQNKVRFNDGKTFMAEQDYNQIIRMGQSDAAISARTELDDLERESGYLSMSNKNFQKYGETIIAIAGDVSLAIPAAWIGSGLKAVGKTAAGIYLTEKIAAGAKATHTAIVGTELGAKTAEVLSRGVSAVQYWRATGAAKDALKAGIQDLSYARRAGAAAEDVAKAEKTVAALTNAAAEGHNLAKQASFLGKSWHFNKFTPKGSALATAEKEITRQAKEALAFSRKLDEAQQAKKLAEATMIADKSAVAV